MQLMQHSVQKSRTTILPRRSLRRIGPAVFSQPEPLSSSGASWASGGAAAVSEEFATAGAASNMGGCDRRQPSIRLPTITRKSAMTARRGQGDCRTEGLADIGNCLLDSWTTGQPGSDQSNVSLFYVARRLQEQTASCRLMKPRGRTHSPGHSLTRAQPASTVI